MENSVWIETLSGFRERTDGTEALPGAVTISAVSGSLALALLAKVLHIAQKRTDVTALLNAARAESTRLAEFADQDILAFHRYMATGDIHEAIEVPMEAARCAVRGLGICAEAAGVVRGLTAADIGAAAALLLAAVSGMLLSVEFNMRECSDEAFCAEVRAQRSDLEREARERVDAVISTQV